MHLLPGSLLALKIRYVTLFLGLWMEWVTFA